MTLQAPLQPEPAVEEPADGRRARGLRSRRLALTEAVQLASVEGLEGLSIARLAERLGLAKSSVHAAFGSKQELQVAAVGRTREMLIDLVVFPALAATEGLPRLRALGKSWFAYLADDVFEGGCLLCAASAEMDGRPGPPRDAVAGIMAEWLRFLADNAATAVAAGDLASGLDPKQLAFELNAIGMAANWQHQLFGDSSAFTAARTAWAGTLDRHRSQPRPRTRTPQP